MLTDRAALAKQYRNAANLNARIALHERFSTNRTDLRRWLFAQMALPADASVVELGCGPGDLWLANRERIPPGWTVLLSDASPGMVRHAARRLSASGLRVGFAVADAQALPYANESFDAVLAHFMLYHVPDRSRALAEMVRILRPGGMFFAATNGSRHMAEARELIAEAGLANEQATRNGDAPGFNLENSEDQLAPWFARFDLRLRRDALRVTEVEPLLAALVSRCEVQAILEQVGETEAGARIAALDRMVRDEIARHGAVQISKESGLFVAQRR